jgi:hypothetical protein
MNEFSRKLQSPHPQFQERGGEVKLHMSPRAYPQQSVDPAYAQRHQETQKIKNLSFWDNTGQETAEVEEGEEEWTERQSATPFILAVIILVVASTLLWFLFQWASSENSNTPLVIPANTAPFKVRPENPGGTKIPHQDKLIYGRLSPDAGPQPMERLLPPPEQPMAAHQQRPFEQAPLSQQPQGMPPQQQPYYSPDHGQGNPQNNLPGYPQNYSQGQQGYAPPSHDYPHPSQGQQQGMQQQQPYPPFQVQAPYHQQQQHPTYVPPAPSPYGPPAVLPPPPTAAPTPQPPVAHTPSKISTVQSIKPASDDENADDSISNDGHNELDQLIAKEAETPLRRSPKKDTKPLKLMALDPGKYKIQIASLPSRSMAEQEIKRLRAHHGAFFGSKNWNIQKVNLGSNRGFTHRLVVGSFPSHTAAAKFCKKLRSEKIGCRVVTPINE